MSHCSLKKILAEIPVRDCFPRVDWEQVYLFLEEHPPADLHETWLSLAREWTGLIVDALGAEYFAQESENFIMVSSRSGKEVRDALQSWEKSHEGVLRALDGIANDDGFGKYVVFDFNSLESYYNYVCDYDDEGEYGGSEACFIPDYYGHFVVSPSGSTSLHLMTHEMTHALLRHLPIPEWLNEGFAELLAAKATGHQPFMNRELFGRHQEYWRQFGLTEFWSGEEFHSATDGQELSYSLATVLVSQLIERDPIAFRQFVVSANMLDAGEQAAKKCFGIGLGEIASAFLGDGDWSPEMPADRDQI